MWVTFGLTLVITASWISKMVIEKQIKIFKTPLDIPLLLFLLSQVLSTVFSIDPHTSLWGYYSRFNGGLYSLLSYSLLYFAFVNNIQRKDVMKYLYVGLGGAVFVALWGLPSHFGYDPTCLLFRGTLDVSCWTFAFQPMVRIFSTLGQPDWLAAYLVFMLLITTGLSLAFWKLGKKIPAWIFFAITILLYVDLLFTKARSGLVGFGIAFGIFALLYIAFAWKSFAKQQLSKATSHHGFFLGLLGAIALFTFLVGTPFSQLDKLSLQGIGTLVKQEKTVQKALQSKNPPAATSVQGIPIQEFGGTDSGKIRLFVWEGAIQVFLHNVLLGTGVETFGYSYYQYRPAGHNLTSEWDYLYNKAHNEYLNYLATTGILGFGTYMLLIGTSLWLMGYGLWKTRNISEEEYKRTNPYFPFYTLRFTLLALLSAYISILVTNFFGFSVVIMNIYLFLTPAFALLLIGSINNEKVYALGSYNKSERVTEVAWIGIGITWLIALYLLVVLFRFWLADISYGLGQNLDHVNQYQTAYTSLIDAVSTRPSEPVFQDELSINNAVLSTALFQQKDTTNGTQLRDRAIALSNKITTEHPNVITFWKSRVRVFYTLAQIDPHYLEQALQAIQKASVLAPTDAKVWYNLGLLYSQTGDVQNAILAMKKTIAMKADYRDAYYALALFYREEALGGDANSKVVKDESAEKNAVEEMHFILTNFDPNNSLKIKETLASWGAE